MGNGLAVVEACRKLRFMEQTYDRRTRVYGSLRIHQTNRLKGLEQEHAMLDGGRRCSMR